MRWTFWDDMNRLKRVALGILTFLRDDDRSASFQTGDLPEDM
jgi:hypothetical protein